MYSCNKNAMYQILSEELQVRPIYKSSVLPLNNLDIKLDVSRNQFKII